MSNICTVPLYSRQQNSLDFIGDIIENSTLDNVVDNVASFLKKEASFATSVQVAEDQEKFEDNIINKLIPNIISEIQKRLDIKLNPLALSTMQKELKNQFLPKVEESEEQNVPITETSEDKKQKEQKATLRQLKNSIFRGSNLLFAHHQDEFSKQLRGIIIYNPNKKQRSLVYDQKTLNENLKQYKQNLYETIYDYCKQNGIKVPQHRNYYNQDNTVKGEDVLDIFYKYLMEISPSQRLELLEKCWEDITLGNLSDKSVNLLQAVNSYITLVKFDELIKDTVGNYVKVEKKLDEPINSIEQNGVINIKYKYNFGRRQSNMQQNFGEEMSNALDKMGNFSKFLIESIPKIGSNENITQIQFINAMLHFKTALRRLSKDSSNLIYKKALESLHKEPKERWKDALDAFVHESNYDQFISDGKMTLEDINIVQSIQKFIYGKSNKDKENSLYKLEQEVHSLIGYKELYSLVDTILGTIDSISEINYSECVWDFENEGYTSKIKRKYFNNKQKLDLISGINQEASKPLSLKQKEKYNISYLEGPFTFKIGNLVVTIRPKKTSEYGIFSQQDLEVTIDGKSLDSYFKDINLTGAENRRNILQATGTLKKGTEKEIRQDKLNKEFLDLLKYIDGALTTGLSINNESLQKFFIYNTQADKGLENLVIAASRTYLIKDIQRKFKDSINNGEINQRTGKPYNERDLHDWMMNNRSQVPVIQFTKEENASNKKYFGVLLGIPYLKPVQYNENWIDSLGDAQAILMGESLKAITKNLEGKSIPNYSPAFLGADIWEVMARNNENPTTKRLLFSTNAYAIKNVLIDTDVKNFNGKSKQTKDMTEAELQYHFFVNKFLLPFRKSKEKPYRSFFSQPTVYSDKSKFIGYEVSLDDLGIVDLKDDNLLIDLIQKSLGEYYSEVQKNTLSMYSKLFTFSQLFNNFEEVFRENPNFLNSIIEQVNNSPTMTIQQIQEQLKNLSLQDLMGLVDQYNSYNTEPIELIQDLHYRNVNGKLGLNEIIIYRNEYFFKNLPAMMEKAAQDYVNTLLNSGVIFDTNAGFIQALEEVAEASGIKLSNWIDSSGMLILAKRHNENEDDEIIVGGGEISNFTNVEINPLLKKYTLLHNLINNNLKEGIFGTDGIHKVKPESAKLSFEEKKLLGFELLESPDLVDAFISIQNVINNEVEAISPDPSEEEMQEYIETLAGLEEVRQKIISQIKDIESAADIAQLKRTVTGPGTMRYYLQGTLTGILPVLNGAIFEDVRASVFNFEGESKENLEAHDGEALLCPITAVWQNNSLQDSEVGDVIKPLWQIEIPMFGGKRLVKYAANTMTNAFMKNSEFSEIAAYNLFRKMTDISWDGQYWSADKNLFNQYSHRRNNTNVSFSDITHSSGALYYHLGNRIFQITGMGFENGAYYTEEQEVTVLNSTKEVKSVKNSQVVYYHYFDSEGNHYKIKEGDPVPEGFHIISDISELNSPDGLHTINSIYELHQVFGGIYSQSFKDGSFVTSEGSNLAVAALLNMVSEKTQKYEEAIKKGVDPKDIPDTQSYYYQPLKYKMIDYLINQSAMKNGTGNINFSSAYLNPENELNDVKSDEPLRSVKMDTQRYGIQQDTEHEADEEELTEMGQVISSIDAGGYYHEEVSELYKAIGHLALEAAKVELSKIKQFNESTDQNGHKNQNILYDLIGRTLIEHISLNRGQNGIAEGLMDRISKHFGTSTDHSLDSIKIAFSDQSIYNQIISTVASILNRKSVKRKFPGTGQVMAAGYNIVQLWQIEGENGKQYARYEDLIKEAIANGFTSDYTTPERYNKDIVKKYLNDRQAKYAKKYTKVIPLKTDGTDYNEEFWEKQLQFLNPIDIIQCTVDGVVLRPIKLDKIKDYYQFKQNPIQYLLSKGLITEIPKEMSIVKRIDIPSNLAPLQYRFKYKDENGIVYSKNVYDIWAVKDMYFAIEDFKQSLDPKLSEYEKDKLVEQERIRLRKIEQNVLSNLEKNIYIDRDGKEYPIIESESKAAQTLMSNIFKTKFGIKTGESLYDILKQGPERFIKSPLKMLPTENLYDLAMLKSNGEGVLVAFNDDEINSVQGFYKIHDKAFRNINEHKVIQGTDGKYYDEVTKDENILGKTIDGQTIYSYIYSLDSNNMETIPIAIKIDVSDKIEFNGENYVYKDTKKKVPKDLDLSINEGKILQTIEFVNKKLVSPKHKNKYIIYNVKEKLISSLLGSNYIENIISGLYQQDNYTYIMPARYINPNNVSVIDKSIDIIRKTTKDKDINKYLQNFQAILSHIESPTENTQGLVQIKGYNKAFEEYKYNKILARKVFESFKESLYFISSRIPAQSLQSFMKMECVGFTNSEANIAYVTHWQTWLQGSDYDIDKSYMLGNEFDDNGLYQGWSPLFNPLYMEESKKLPYPTGIKCYLSKDKFGVGVSIEEFVNRYIELGDDEKGKLNLLNELIRYINKQTPEYSEDLGDNIILIAKYDDDKKRVRRELIDLVRSHNSFQKGLSVTEASLKNFISNKLQRIIQGTSNFIGSHAPITMDYLHEAADQGKVSQKWNTTNPGYIPLMQTQAMVGKKGVGIAANGQKGSFIWKYWMTDCINNNNPYKDFVRFPENFHIDRIEGRFGFIKFNVGSIQDKHIKRLPDVNMYNASEEDKLFYAFNEDHYIPSDQMSSQMISAATDNAKELILDRINANTDLSKVYMYLIALGFDVKDIVFFMTSPIIDLIARNSTQNIFLNTSFRTQDVANYILGTIDSILEQGLNEEEKTQRGDINSLDGRYIFVLDSKIKAILGDTSDTKKLQNMKADIEEFLKIYELSEEFSYTGRFLGINGGVPTTKEGLIDFKKFIKNMFSSRELYKGLKTRKKGKFEVAKDLSFIPEDLQGMVDNLDADRYLADATYRYNAMRYYELIKGSINIPAMVEGAEQFQTILEIANIINVIDGEGIAKSKAQNIIYNKILKKFPYADSKYAMQILPILNQVFISSFLEENPITIPVQKDWKYLSKKWQIETFKENGEFTIGGTNYGLTVDTSISSFHYLMDEFIIPALKNGELFDLSDNAFIQNLIPIIDGTEVRYKINIDMRAAQTNPESKVILKDIINDLQELQNYKFGDKTLLDIFMLYSLVVDQNRQGSDRLTDLFTTFIHDSNSQNNLLLDYFTFMGEIEHNNSDFISRIEKLSVNGFLVSLASQVASKNGHNEPSIKTVSISDGRVDYQFNVGFGQYRSFGDFLPRVALEAETQKLLRIANRERYKFGLIYDGYILDTLDNFENLDDSQMWLQTFSDLVSQGDINLDPQCN